VVTGLGAKTPAGLTPRESFDALLSGKSAAQLIGHLVGDEVPMPLGAPVTGFDPAAYFGHRELPGLDRAARLGAAAALDAVADSGLSPEGDPERYGVMTGVAGTAAAVAMSEAHRGRTRIDSYSAARAMPNATAAHISMRLGLRGPSTTYSTACASGSTAVGEAFHLIRYGRLDAAVAGGTDSQFDPYVMESFQRIGAMSSRRDAPHEASRPFDADRDGFVMGEGAAFLVLEDRERALARGARIYAEIAGYGSNCDAFHLVMPRRDGSVAASCMSAALADAGIEPSQVGHVNAHGTSTPRNDQAEARALATVFGTEVPPVTAPKGVVGHMFGAAGAFEALVTVLTVAEGVVPPVANHRRTDEGVTLDVVTGRPRRVAPAPGLSNSFGFGGHNSTLVFRPA
jgi:3-oxoacyl-[acyl-carrier-protein] synthase II